MNKKYLLVFFICLIVLVGCSSQNNKVIDTGYKIVEVGTSDANTSVILLYYTSEEGDMYYRVLPSSITMDNPEVIMHNGYPVNWTKIPNPSVMPKD